MTLFDDKLTGDDRLGQEGGPQNHTSPTSRLPDSPTSCRGIRGATTADADTAEDIIEATQELVSALIRLNDIQPEDIASAIFTTTPDLTATFPALAARQLGWSEVPLICSHEMNVPGALDHVVRILLHVNTTKSAAEIRHVYLKRARQLRPEWGVSAEELEALGQPTPAAVGGKA